VGRAETVPLTPRQVLPAPGKRPTRTDVRSGVGGNRG